MKIYLNVFIEKQDKITQFDTLFQFAKTGYKANFVASLK